MSATDDLEAGYRGAQRRTGPVESIGPSILQSVECVLRGALALADASLVIFRHGALVEFKTQMLDPGLVTVREGKHRGWQIGDFAGHHCHLDLASVTQVWFDAEPVSCQGGRLNYTVWFLADRDCGNPFRPDGLFSVTLNAPYEEDGTPRIENIDAVYRLYDLQRERAGVSASDAFLSARPSAYGVGRHSACHRDLVARPW